MLPAMNKPPSFADRNALTEKVEETRVFAPKFGPDSLIPVAATDAASGRLLMLAFMNAEALAKTIDTGEAWYWSRDQDAIEIVVDQVGPACHTERRSCFYRVVEGRTVLKFEN